MPVEIRVSANSRVVNKTDGQKARGGFTRAYPYMGNRNSIPDLSDEEYKEFITVDAQSAFVKSMIGGPLIVDHEGPPYEKLARSPNNIQPGELTAQQIQQAALTCSTRIGTIVGAEISPVDNAIYAWFEFNSDQYAQKMRALVENGTYGDVSVGYIFSRNDRGERQHTFVELSICEAGRMKDTSTIFLCSDPTKGKKFFSIIIIYFNFDHDPFSLFKKKYSNFC